MTHPTPPVSAPIVPGKAIPQYQNGVDNAKVRHPGGPPQKIEGKIALKKYFISLPYAVKEP